MLKITASDGTQIYNGSIKDYTLREIANLNSGETKELIATISLPAELGNEYALKKASILWIYNGEYEGKENPDVIIDPASILWIYNGEYEGKENPDVIIDPDEKDSQNGNKAPITGDIKLDFYLVLFIISTIGLFSTIAINNKKENLEER